MSTHLEIGSRNEVAFVLSCPSRLEKQAGHPAAGVTGRNLERLLEMLKPRLGLPSLERAEVTITNAWDKIEYRSGTGRSEATDTELKQTGNLHRLADELRHITTLVIFCGCKAKVASQELLRRGYLPSSAQIAFLEHLGTRGLLAITSDTADAPILSAAQQRRHGRSDSLRRIQSENTHRRLEVVLERLLSSARSVS